VFSPFTDAGKSTIGGHIMYLTGQVDKRTLEKYEREAKEKNRESWYLSWALDTNAEERDKVCEICRFLSKNSDVFPFRVKQSKSAVHSSKLS
jgi:translation elongation factor EF-1alpha